MASNLQPNRTLAGVGAILLTIGSLFPPLALVGIIILLVALKGLSEYYNEQGIYRDALYGVVFGIIGIGAAIVLFVSFFFRMRMSRIVSPSPLISPLNMQSFRMLFGLILILGVMFLFFLLEAIFLRKSFDRLAAKAGERMFETAGLLLLIGAVLTIVLVGFIILFAAWIVAAVAFFSLRTAQQAPSAPEPPPQPEA
jgi:uncharacterized membrane protein